MGCRIPRRPALAAAFLLFVSSSPLFGLPAGIAAVPFPQDCGDVNADGAITVADALATLQAAVGAGPSCDLCVCDLDCDRESTSTDALLVLRGAVRSGEATCCVVDACFTDEDCPAGMFCGADPRARCDFACVECISDEDCEPGLVCTADGCLAPSAPAMTPAGGFALAAPGADGGDVAGDEGGNFLVAWSEHDENNPVAVRIRAQRYDASRNGFDDPVELAHSETDQLRPVTACASGESTFVVVWQREPTLWDVPDGIYRDLSNVVLRPHVPDASSVSANVIVNELTDGLQRSPAIACAAGDTALVAWNDTCAAIEKRTKPLVGTRSFVHFRPDDCDPSHPDGVYVRAATTGAASFGPVQRIPAPEGSLPGNPALAALDDGAFVVFAPFGVEGGDERTRIVRVEPSGEQRMVVELEEVPDYFEQPTLACAGARCLAMTENSTEGIVAYVFDVTEPGEVRRIVIAEHEPPAGEAGRAAYLRRATAACDRNGLCVVVWVREESELSCGDCYDARTTTRTTALARPVDLETATLGAAREFEGWHVDGGAAFEPSLAALGDGRFVAVLFTDTAAQIRGRFLEVR